MTTAFVTPTRPVELVKVNGRRWEARDITTKRLLAVAVCRSGHDEEWPGWHVTAQGSAELTLATTVLAAKAALMRMAGQAVTEAVA